MQTIKRLTLLFVLMDLDNSVVSGKISKLLQVLDDKFGFQGRRLDLNIGCR